jgi:hypothetical protein
MDRDVALFDDLVTGRLVLRDIIEDRRGAADRGVGPSEERDGLGVATEGF